VPPGWRGALDAHGNLRLEGKRGTLPGCPYPTDRA